MEEVPNLLRAREVNEFAELKREGLSIQAISSVTGFDRKTVRKYLLKPDEIPAYGPRRRRRANWTRSSRIWKND